MEGERKLVRKVWPCGASLLLRMYGCDTALFSWFVLARCSRIHCFLFNTRLVRVFARKSPGATTRRNIFRTTYLTLLGALPLSRVAVGDLSRANASREEEESC